MASPFRLHSRGKLSHSNAADLLKDSKQGLHCVHYSGADAAGQIVDDNGLIVALSPTDSTPQRPNAKDLFQLHHINILTPNWRRSRDFYQATFGLRSVMEFVDEDDGAFLFLADAFVDFAEHNLLLELTGPPWGEQREADHFDRNGPSVDHICYTTPDVDAAWRQLIDAGASDVTAPYDAWGTRIAWVKDLVGKDIELMLPIDKDAFD